jgi:hypothetical protein
MAHRHRWIEIDGEGSWTGYGCRCGMVKEVDHQDNSFEVRESKDPDELQEQIDQAILPRHDVAYGYFDGNLQRWDLQSVYLPARASTARIEKKAEDQLEKTGIEISFVTLYYRGNTPEERLT